MRGLNLASIPPNASFLDALAAEWLRRHPDRMGRGIILLPTRRAARALGAAFLNAAGGRALLLPRIAAIGALDEAPLALEGALDLPPPVDEMQRLSALSRLILKLPEAQGGARTADRAWMLARELATLMDEAERAELDLPDALGRASGGEHAEHWRVTLAFLDIVTRAWPAWLAEQGLMNPVARQSRLLRTQAEAWTVNPPDEPVWAAGTTGAIPAVAHLLRAVARLPQGQVVLPGLDIGMTDQAWEALEPTHPQAGLRSLLSGLDAARGDVERWDAPALAPEGRVSLFCRALLPATCLSAWREPADISTEGLLRLSPSDQQEEAAAIALVLREAMEVPGRRAALVTPDRVLAGRVSAELLRWGIVADDSAGEPLSQAPPGTFLRLLAQAVANALSPVALLAVLKHPFTALGMTPAACRAAARALEISSLRGPKPGPGLTGLRQVAKGEAAEDLVSRLEVAIAPLLRVAASTLVPPAATLESLVAVAEAFAATPDEEGPSRLWALEEGEALAALLASALPALAELPDQPPASLPGLLDAILEGAVVRSRRALRGRENAAEHPRVFIWGLLEARLQSADVIVLGGLAETVWPPSTDPGPWMSRPMRIRAGLPSPEELVGQTAHDFVSTACAAPVAVLSSPRRRDAAPAVPARWLARLRACLAGQGQALAEHPAAEWVRALDQPAGPPIPARAPRPCPPVALRPRVLGITEIETWLADPYAIHARHVLRLRKLDPLEQSTDASDYGQLVHAGLHRFLSLHGTAWPKDATRELREAMDFALLQAGLRPALRAWWTPRLHRIADWVAEEERDRRSEIVPALIVSEVAGDWSLDVPGGFTLRGRADRIERRQDGSLAILDYKTGEPPSEKAVAAGFFPQLPLEAAMAEDGGFGEALKGQAVELTYWHLSGGFEPGRVRALFEAKPEAMANTVAEARAKLRALITAFDDPARPYLARPHPSLVPRFSDYAQLARVAEWDLAGEDI